jgi:signal transduction histidine kinase
MAQRKDSSKNLGVEADPGLHFDVSTGLKRVLGRELITNDEVAIFEMVKNSFDARAKSVHLYFDDDSIIVADDGVGMSYEELNSKWLFVAYSSKKASKGFRDRAQERSYYAGSKGIGRFSSDRLGEELVLQTRPKGSQDDTIHQLRIDWSRFEEDEKQRFETIPVDYEVSEGFDLPESLSAFRRRLRHGTAITIKGLRRHWDRSGLVALKASLAKLINPFGAEVDRFKIYITAPAEREQDEQVRRDAARSGETSLPKDIVNGQIGNFIFSDLKAKTTFISVSIEYEHIHTTLTDRGEVIYEIREPNIYAHLKDSGFRCEIYYLNHAAKLTFARRVGLPSVQFGSVFLFRNGFRVYPIGSDEDDWFGFNRRKQQGYSRFLGTREIIGRVDVYGSDEDFQEASSRNQGLIETRAVEELRKAVMDHCLKRLERYVVPVSWVDKLDADTEDLSRLLTEPGRARVSAVVASLVDNEEVELLDYSRQLVTLINERSSDFESSLSSLRAVAEKTGDKRLLLRVRTAEKRFNELKKSEAEARRIADQEKAAAEAATARAEEAEAAREHEQRRANFLESVVDLDTATILNLHHQVTIYAVDIAQQIENLLAGTTTQKTIPRDVLLSSIEQIAFLNRKILAITRFAAKATFQLDSEKIQADLPVFIQEYVENIVRTSGSARLRIEVTNDHPGMKLRFNPIDVSIVVDNLISNARRARASRITFELSALEKTGLAIRVTDNGIGLARGVDPDRIFEMGYSTTRGSGLGLYHVRQVLGEMGGTIEIGEAPKGRGAEFLIKIGARKRAQ